MGLIFLAQFCTYIYVIKLKVMIIELIKLVAEIILVIIIMIGFSNIIRIVVEEYDHYENMN